MKKYKKNSKQSYYCKASWNWHPKNTGTSIIILEKEKSPKFYIEVMVGPTIKQIRTDTLKAAKLRADEVLLGMVKEEGVRVARELASIKHDKDCLLVLTAILEIEAEK
jgi:hypothetical protein